jgi:hypothetical protein
MPRYRQPGAGKPERRRPASEGSERAAPSVPMTSNFLPSIDAMRASKGLPPADETFVPTITLLGEHDVNMAGGARKQRLLGSSGKDGSPHKRGSTKGDHGVIASDKQVQRMKDKAEFERSFMSEKLRMAGYSSDGSVRTQARRNSDAGSVAASEAVSRLLHGLIF